MRKLLSLLLAISTFGLGMVALSACDVGGPHEHVLVRYEEKLGNCKETGWTAYEKCTKRGCDYTTYQELPVDPENHEYQGHVCALCGDVEVYSEGLAYTLRSDGKSYKVKDVGTCADVDIRIPTKYEGLPVVEVGTKAFAENAGLTSIFFPKTIKTIGKEAFYQCQNLQTVTIPDSVTKIGDSAFANCTNLTSAVVGNGVTAINKSLFAYCTNLSSVVIGDGVTDIETQAFFLCGNLTDVVLGKSVQNIGEGVFFYCMSLTKITIPASVQTIGKMAFVYCVGLTEVTFENTNGWTAVNVTDETDKVALASEDLLNVSTAANYVVNTYCSNHSLVRK